MCIVTDYKKPTWPWVSLPILTLLPYSNNLLAADHPATFQFAIGSVLTSNADTTPRFLIQSNITFNSSYTPTVNAAITSVNFNLVNPATILNATGFNPASVTRLNQRLIDGDPSGGNITGQADVTFTGGGDLNINQFGYKAADNSGSGIAIGGAIYSSRTLTFNTGGSVVITDNQAAAANGGGSSYSNTSAQGGAIASERLITFSNGGDVQINNNKADAGDNNSGLMGGSLFSAAYGGAIFGRNQLVFSNNGNVQLDAN